MGDTLQDAINALRAAGLEREAKAVEELRARQSATMDAYHAGQRASYADGLRDGRNPLTPTPTAGRTESNSLEFDGIRTTTTTKGITG